MSNVELSIKDYEDFIQILKNPGLNSFRDLSFVVRTEFVKKMGYMSLNWSDHKLAFDTLIAGGIYESSMTSLLHFINAKCTRIDPTIADRLHLFMESDNYILQ